MKNINIRLIIVTFLATSFNISCKSPSDELANVGSNISLSLKKSEKRSTISIASFNVQFFNDRKSSDIFVMKYVTKILSNFDIVAFQEIQGTKNSTVKKIYNKVKHQYNYIVSPRLGYSRRYKEQYAYFYKKGIVKHIDHYVFNDKLDEFSREPLVAKFNIVSSNKDIVIIVIHTPPKFAAREIRKLPLVISDATEKYSSDIIILGDFNADCKYYDESNYRDTFPSGKYLWAIDNNEDTTVKRTVCTYDRIVLTNTLSEYFIESGVFQFDKIYDLPYKKAVRISDHYPVWVRLGL